MRKEVDQILDLILEFVNIPVPVINLNRSFNYFSLLLVIDFVLILSSTILKRLFYYVA